MNITIKRQSLLAGWVVMQPLKRHAVMRCARSRSSAHTVFFLPARLLFPTLLSDIFQILNPRLFSSCLQNRQRLKKEERARSQAKCRRTSCDTCPSSCPPEQLGATIAEMGDHARIDVDSPLWDQTTFIGLPSKSAENDLRRKNSGRFRHFAWMSNPLSGLNSTATLMEAKKLVSAKKEVQPDFYKYLNSSGGRLSRWARACWDNQGASCERHGSV